MSSWDPTAKRPWTLAYIVRATLAQILLVWFRVRRVHVGRVPRSGAILAGNHVSYGDPVLLWCAAPRRVRFMAKSELWSIRPLGWIISRLWGFPVKRGEADRQSIAVATTLLRDGELVGIFPEGTRVREGVSEAQGGVAFLALRASVPVVPVGIAGTDRIRPKGVKLLRFPRITFVFGEPVLPEDFAHLPGRKERIEAMTAEIMRRIGESLEEARGA